MRARALELARGALASLDAARARLDDLNVFPVPDGDTGSNMVLTWRAVVGALESAETDDRAALARTATRAALLGARGNSGVILSQIVRGAAESLAVDDDLARAFRGACDAAYAAVPVPVEGTMLTAARALAAAAEAGGDLAAIVASGDEAVARTPTLLPQLAEAGVVDAGAAGLVELVRGIAAAVSGQPLPPAPIATAPISLDAVHRELSRFRYCTTFVVEGEHLDAGALERELEELGDSLLVVGAEDALKVHVHTDDPGRALSLGVAAGTISGIEIANMHEQTLAREARLATSPPVPTAVVAVADGEGNRRLLESLGASTLPGNPSAGEIAAAIEQARAETVIVLPNDGNVVLTAEQAVAASARSAEVLPTASVQAGLAALVAFDGARPAGDNLDAMRTALAGVATGAVAMASRGLRSNGFAIRPGDWLGLAEGEPVAGEPTFEEAARSVVEHLLARPRDVLTLLTGAGSPPLEGLLAAVAARHPDVEVEVHDGGQTAYALLLSAE